MNHSETAEKKPRRCWPWGHRWSERREVNAYFYGAYNDHILLGHWWECGNCLAIKLRRLR